MRGACVLVLISNSIKPSERARDGQHTGVLRHDLYDLRSKLTYTKVAVDILARDAAGRREAAVGCKNPVLVRLNVVWDHHLKGLRSSVIRRHADSRSKNGNVVPRKREQRGRWRRIVAREKNKERYKRGREERRHWQKDKSLV